MKLSRRTIILLALLGVAALTVTVISVFGLLAHPGDSQSLPNPGGTSERSSSPPGDPLIVDIRESTDPVVFAKSVTTALFQWDTMQRLDRGDIIDAILEVSDPTGYETAGLYSDLGGYLPTDAQWQQLREYATKQHLESVTIEVPEGWAAIAADPANELPDEIVAVTVDGVRVRSGSWHGQHTSKRFDMEFTLFVSCPETAESCSLLRLSALGSALR